MFFSLDFPIFLAYNPPYFYPGIFMNEETLALIRSVENRLSHMWRYL